MSSHKPRTTLADLTMFVVPRYVASRIFLHNPPGEGNAFRPTPNAPEEIHKHEIHLAQADPEVNPWFCVTFLVVTIAVMAATAEWVSWRLIFCGDS